MSDCLKKNAEGNTVGILFSAVDSFYGLSGRVFVSWSRRYLSHVSGDTIILLGMIRVLDFVYYIT
jgi:hypothetical protein